MSRAKNQEENVATAVADPPEVGTTDAELPPEVGAAPPEPDAAEALASGAHAATLPPQVMKIVHSFARDLGDIVAAKVGAVAAREILVDAGTRTQERADELHREAGDDGPAESTPEITQEVRDGFIRSDLYRLPEDIETTISIIEGVSSVLHRYSGKNEDLPENTVFSVVDIVDNSLEDLRSHVERLKKILLVYHVDRKSTRTAGGGDGHDRGENKTPAPLTKIDSGALYRFAREAEGVLTLLNDAVNHDDPVSTHVIPASYVQERVVGGLDELYDRIDKGSCEATTEKMEFRSALDDAQRKPLAQIVNRLATYTADELEELETMLAFYFRQPTGERRRIDEAVELWEPSQAEPTADEREKRLAYLAAKFRTLSDAQLEGFENGVRKLMMPLGSSGPVADEEAATVAAE